MFTTVIIMQTVMVCILLFELLYVLSQKPSKMQAQLTVTLISVILIVVSYTVELCSPDLNTALLSVCYSYIGVPYAMLETMFFIMTYCGCEPSPRKRTILALCVLIFPIMVFTNNYHHLYYTSVSYDRSQVLSPLVLEHGPLYFVFVGATVAYFIYSAFISIREYRRCKTKIERNQTIYVFATELSALLGYMLYLSGILGSYDGTMIGYFLSTMFLMILFFKCKLFDTLGYSKECALKSAFSGLAVIDNRNKLSYINDVADELLKRVFTKNEILDLPVGTSFAQKEEKYYTIVKTKIEHDSRIISNTVEIIDSTESHNYSLKLEHEVQMQVEELRHIQRKVIAGISDIVEARDSDTGSHIKKTCLYTKGIVDELRRLGYYTDILTDKYCNYLVDASSMHDIGKLTIPDEILCKPAKLTEEEFERMKTHSKAGSDIIEKTMRGIEDDAYVDIAKDVARYHHEKWNGTGYPDHLSGENIPLAARIVAVADVFEALTSPRCYKDPIDDESACNIIHEGRGHHFDPNVVLAFLNAFHQGKFS